jgi:hypothetical protein
MSRKSSINKIKRDNSKSKDISAAFVMYLYEKSHSPISTRFTGMGLSECDVILGVGSKVTSNIQEIHSIIYHALCGEIERAFTSDVLPS